MESTMAMPGTERGSRTGAWLLLGLGSVAVVAGTVWYGSRPDVPPPPTARIEHTVHALEGTVTCNGELLTAGSVVLWTPSGASNYSLIFPNGKYRIDNAPRGKVRLTVSAKSGPPVNLLPKPGEGWPSELMRSPSVPVAPQVALRPKALELPGKKLPPKQAGQRRRLHSPPERAPGRNGRRQRPYSEFGRGPQRARMGLVAQGRKPPNPAISDVESGFLPTHSPPPERAPVGYARHLAGVDVVLTASTVAGISGRFDGRDPYSLARPDDAEDAPELALNVPEGTDPATLVIARSRVRVLLHPPGREFRTVREVRVEVLE